MYVVQQELNKVMEETKKKEKGEKYEFKAKRM